MDINKGDVLCIPDPNSDGNPEVDRLDVIALESGPNPQVLAPQTRGHGLTKHDLATAETFQLTGDLVTVHERTQSRLNAQLQEMVNSSSGIDTSSLTNDIIKKIAEQLTDATIDILTSTSKDLKSSSQQAVEEFLRNNPEVAEKLAHPDAAELAEIVVSSFLTG